MRRGWTTRLAILASVAFLLSSSLSFASESKANVLFIAVDARSVAKSAPVSFEQSKAGRFDKLETAIGAWTPIDGRTIIDDKHAKTGKQCLQLTGGQKTSVTLDIADGVGTTGELTFHAERWTTRAPFSFRIEKNNGKGWKEVFNGDKEVRVGRAFLSHVKVPLGDDSIKRLRFMVTSPPNTGILIDDIRLAPARPQEIVGVEVVPLTLPALVGTDASPLLKLKIETVGSLKPISLTGMHGKLEGAAEIESLHLSRGERGEKVQLAITSNSSSASWKPTPLQLADGANFMFVGCKLKNNANIDHRVGASIAEVTFSNGKTFKLGAAPSVQRMGVAVRKRGDDGVNTYRIPGLATTNKGTLIGVYDVRQRTGGDLPGDIDVGMSRSTDGGRTWETMQVIMDMGDDPKWHYDGIGDPAVLVDKNTGTIWVAATWSHGNRSWRGSGPGMNPEETGQLMLVRSDDDGVTWSKPINITSQVKKPEWCFILQGPGKGITMRDGTIVFAAQYQDPPAKRRLPHSTIIYSKDHGESWQVGTGAFDDTTESQVVEIEPGVLMLNCRYNRQAVRVVMTTRDMGKTWHKHTTSERSLIEPGSCMASLIDVDQEVGKDVGKWLLFSNPDSTRGRHHIMIKASSDRGLTWPKVHRLLLDEGNSAGYSCMSMIDEKTVGILYEGSQAHMTFQRIPLSDLVGKTGNPVRPALKPTEQSLKLPRVFGSHMVLQADAKIPVWGHAKSDAKVTATLGDASQTVVANAKGEWIVRFPARKASATPASMVIESADERIQFTDVLVGEVWVCAGQSNMEWTLGQSANGEDELSQADHPQVRLLHLVGGARGSSGSYTQKHLARLTPETYCEGEWKVASAESAQSFSAVGWYFGRHLQEELKVPVGLICPAVGGTPAEAWIPREALAADADYTRQTGHIGLATHRFSMYRDFKTMPARFQQAGYYTGFLGKTHINPERLVENYVDHRAIRNSNFGKTISIETYAEEAGVVMRNAAESKKPFLLIINYADAHRRFVGKSKQGFPTRQVDDVIEPFPWIGSDTPHLREELRDYFNCMNRLDEGVGMVLDKLDESGTRDNTLVIYISDHGADFPRGKGSIYEHGTRIPMIVNYPKSFPKGKVESGMVSTIDILPTMLRAARLPVPENLPGFALQDIDSGKSPSRKYIHTFTTGSSPNLLYLQFGVRDERYKLVYNPDRALNRLAESRYQNSQLPEDQYVQSFLRPPEFELFDLQEDPYEWSNLAGSAEHRPIKLRLLKAMQDFQRQIKDPFASKENVATFIAEQKEYLHKPYKKPGFRWPHLDMFKKAQEFAEKESSRQIVDD